jgi:hypothetical protein
VLTVVFVVWTGAVGMTTPGGIALSVLVYQIIMLGRAGLTVATLGAQVAFMDLRPRAEDLSPLGESVEGLDPLLGD